MIRSLRRKFILIAMLSLMGTFAVLCAAICIGNDYAVSERADRAIDLLYQNGGEFPNPDGDPADPAAGFRFQVTPETPFETRYFIVELTERRATISVDTEHIATFDRQNVTGSIDRILASGKNRGYDDYYRFRVFQNEDGGSTIIVLDCFLQLQSAHNMLRITLLVSVSCALIVFILLLFFSNRAIRPFVENLERQRQFVTDASHELKTPLAILSANMGLLEDAYGESRWLKSARTQVSRLDKLIRNLVELARTEETVREEHISSFFVSEVAQAGMDAFQPMAEADGKSLTAEIAPNICVRGVQDNSGFLRSCWTTRSNTVTREGIFISPCPSAGGTSAFPSPIPARGWTLPCCPGILTGSTARIPPAQDRPAVMASACLPPGRSSPGTGAIFQTGTPTGSSPLPRSSRRAADI